MATYIILTLIGTRRSMHRTQTKPLSGLIAAAALLSLLLTGLAAAECLEYKIVETEDSVEAVCVGKPLTPEEQKQLQEEEARARKAAEEEQKQKKARQEQEERAARREQEKKQAEQRAGEPRRPADKLREQQQNRQDRRRDRNNPNNPIGLTDLK